MFHQQMIHLLRTWMPIKTLKLYQKMFIVKFGMKEMEVLLAVLFMKMEIWFEVIPMTGSNQPLEVLVFLKRPDTVAHQGINRSTPKKIEGQWEAGTVITFSVKIPE